MEIGIQAFGAMCVHYLDWETSQFVGSGIVLNPPGGWKSAYESFVLFELPTARGERNAVARAVLKEFPRYFAPDVVRAFFNLQQRDMDGILAATTGPDARTWRHSRFALPTVESGVMKTIDTLKKHLLGIHAFVLTKGDRFHPSTLTKLEDFSSMNAADIRRLIEETPDPGIMQAREKQILLWLYVASRPGVPTDKALCRTFRIGLPVIRSVQLQAGYSRKAWQNLRNRERRKLDILRRFDLDSRGARDIERPLGESEVPNYLKIHAQVLLSRNWSKRQILALKLMDGVPDSEREKLFTKLPYEELQKRATGTGFIRELVPEHWADVADYLKWVKDHAAPPWNAIADIVHIAYGSLPAALKVAGIEKPVWVSAMERFVKLEKSMAPDWEELPAPAEMILHYQLLVDAGGNRQKLLRVIVPYAKHELSADLLDMDLTRGAIRTSRKMPPDSSRLIRAYSRRYYSAVEAAIVPISLISSRLKTSPDSVERTIRNFGVSPLPWLQAERRFKNEVA